MSRHAQLKVQPIHSNGYAGLMQFCRTLCAPHTEHDVRAFNAIYRCVYPGLSREERRRAERLVDRRIDGLENRKLGFPDLWRGVAGRATPRLNQRVGAALRHFGLGGLSPPVTGC